MVDRNKGQKEQPSLFTSCPDHSHNPTSLYKQQEKENITE